MNAQPRRTEPSLALPSVRTPAWIALVALASCLAPPAWAQAPATGRVVGAPQPSAPAQQASELTQGQPLEKTYGYLKLHKKWINAIVNDRVTITATSSGTTNTSSIDSTANTANETDNAANYVNLVIGSTVTLPAESFVTGSQSNYTTTVACTGATPASSSPPTTYVNPSAIVDCTYTNTRKSTKLTLKKVWVDAKVGDAVSFTATGLANSATAALASTASSANDTDTGTQVTVYAGEVATLGETFTTGSQSNYDSLLSCTGTTGLSGSTLTIKPDEGPIVCTYTNTRKKRNLTLQKTWAYANVGDQVTMTTAGLANNATITSVADTPSETDVGQTVSNFAGATVTLPVETFGPGSQANYTTTVSCTGATPSSSSPPATFTMPEGDVVCTYTNTRKTSTLQLKKTWVDAKVGDAVSVTATGIVNAATAALASTANTASETDPGSVVTVYAGEVATLSESFTTGSAANYTTTGPSCTGTTGLSGSTLTVKPGEGPIVCTYTNTRPHGTLRLRKTWVNANVGDTAQVSATGIQNAAGAALNSTADSANDSDTGTPVTMYAGETALISELVNPSGNYTSSFECTELPKSARAKSVGDQFTMPNPPSDYVCTYTNTRKSATLQLKKTWVNAHVGDTASLTATGLTNSATVALNSTADSANETDAGTAVTVFAGEVATLGETVNPAANYTSTGPSCTGTSGLSGSTLTVGAADTVIVCTYTNTRKSGTLQVKKTWVNAHVGDTAAISVTGIVNAATAGLNSTADSANETDVGSIVTMYAGETANFSETVNPAANYTSSFSCATADPKSAMKNVGDTYTMPSPPIDVVCTYTNTRKSATLQLKKTWVNAHVGDTASLTATGLANSATVALNSTADSANETDAGTAVTVFAGEVATLGETVNPAGNYTSTGPSCTGTSGLSGSTLTVGAADTTIVCTYTNTRKVITLQLKKTWITALVGNTVSLSASGFANGAAAGFDSTAQTANETDDGPVVNVFAGETGNLSEGSIGGPTGGTWQSGLACAGNSIALAGNALTVSPNDTAVVCTFTNQRFPPSPPPPRTPPITVPVGTPEGLALLAALLALMGAWSARRRARKG